MFSWFFFYHEQTHKQTNFTAKTETHQHLTFIPTIQVLKRNIPVKLIFTFSLNKKMIECYWELYCSSLESTQSTNFEAFPTYEKLISGFIIGGFIYYSNSSFL